MLYIIYIACTILNISSYKIISFEASFDSYIYVCIYGHFIAINASAGLNNHIFSKQ